MSSPQVKPFLLLLFLLLFLHLVFFFFRHVFRQGWASDSCVAVTDNAAAVHVGVKNLLQKQHTRLGGCLTFVRPFCNLRQFLE